MTINWFDQHIQLNEVGTALFVTVIVLILLITVVVNMKSIMKRKWLCPRCNKSFKPKCYQCLFVVHWGNDQMLRCPHCGKVKLCWEAKHTEDE